MLYTDDFQVYILHSGKVTWIPQIIMEASCTVHAQNFPRDEVNCFLKVLNLWGQYIVKCQDSGVSRENHLNQHGQKRTKLSLWQETIIDHENWTW